MKIQKMNEILNYDFEKIIDVLAKQGLYTKESLENSRNCFVRMGNKDDYSISFAENKISIFYSIVWVELDDEYKSDIYIEFDQNGNPIDADFAGSVY